MPVAQTRLPIPIITPEDFEYIPETNSYVAVSKLMDSEGNVISGIQGYKMVQIAQNLELYLTSSGEWGISREHFWNNSDKEFKERTGKEIENSYISGHIEQTSSFLSFKTNGQYPRDTHDLLKKAGFDGRIALIDFPYVQKDKDEFIFIKSPRIKIRDVTEIKGKPFPEKDGNVQDYDRDTGLITEVGSNPNPEFHNAHYLVVPEGTRMVLRGCWRWLVRGSRHFGVGAGWGPSDSGGGVSARLSSRNKPSEILTPDRIRILAAKQKVLGEFDEQISELAKNYNNFGTVIENLRKLGESIKDIM